MLTLLAFLVTLAVLVVVHEYGHYKVAKLCGVKVLRFSVGFGRVILRRQAHPDATEYTLSMLPLGGYVRMLDEREGAVSAELLPQAFNRKPLWQRAAIVAAGPVANFVLAIVLFAAVACIGQDEPKAVLGSPLAGSVAEHAGMRAGDWVQSASRDGVQWQELDSLLDLRWQLLQSLSASAPLYLQVADRQGHGQRQVLLDLSQLGVTEPDAAAMRKLGLGFAFSEPRLGALTAGGPGDRAGLREGDRVLSVNGRMISDAGQLRETIRGFASQQGDAPMLWRLERAGQVLELSVRPAIVEQDGQSIGRIEAQVGAPPELVLVRKALPEALWLAVSKTWDQSVMTLKTFGRMLVGQASLKNLSGPLTIADYAGQSARLGVVEYLAFLAMLSVGLGVLNLLPLPMLDGGHLMYYLFEGLSGRPVSEWWLKRLQRAGALVMLLMMALALSNDVTRLLGLH